MKTIKTLALLLAAGSIAAPLCVRAATNVTQQFVLLEQAVNFKLKITTLNKPDVKTGLTEATAKLKTLSAAVSTKDVLRTLGFSPSAQIIVRLLVTPGILSTNEYGMTDSYATNDVRVLVKSGGSETDVTSMLGKLVSSADPVESVVDGVFASGVVKGQLYVSLTKGLTAALNTLSYEHASANITNMQVTSSIRGNLEVDGMGLSKSVIGVKGGFSPGVSLSLSTSTQLLGGGVVSHSSFLSGFPVPGVIEGAITTKGKNTITTLSLIELLDLGGISVRIMQ